MNNISWRRVFFFIFLLTLSIGSCRAQIFHKNPEKQLFDKTLGEKKEVKVKETQVGIKS